MIRMTTAAITVLLSISAAQTQEAPYASDQAGTNLHSEAIDGVARRKAREYCRGYGAELLHQRSQGWALMLSSTVMAAVVIRIMIVALAYKACSIAIAAFQGISSRVSRNVLSEAAYRIIARARGVTRCSRFH